MGSSEENNTKIEKEERMGEEFSIHDTNAKMR